MPLKSHASMNWSLPVRIGAWLVFALAGLNTLVYVLTYSDPLIVADGWYFLDVFIRPALDGSLQPGDFFISRMGLDHAQPLRKLILLMELHWFDLDFVPQAVIGVFCAGGCSLIVAKVMRQTGDREVPAYIRALAWAAVTAILFSLNSTHIWTWPLVAVAYSSHVIVFGFLAVMWIAVESGRVRWLVAITLLLAVVGDDTALIVVAAVLPVLALLWVRGVQRASIPRVLTVSVGIVVVVQLLMAWLAPVVGGAPQVDDRSGLLWQHLLADGWWKWWVLPLSNAVIDPSQLAGRVQNPVPWRVALAVALAVAHLWFWWRFLRSQVNGASFFAAALMLLFYALVAGIIFGRVSIFGSGYLDQPRYVLLYQFHLIALLVMLVATNARPMRAWQRTLAVGVPVFLVLALQVSLAKESWRIAPWIHAYYAKMAQQTVALAEHPERVPENCLPQLIACNYAVEKRRDVMAFLQKHQLSVFSPVFRQRHEYLFQSIPGPSPQPSPPRAGERE